MVKVIGLCGSIGAGKDVVAKFLVKEYGYVQITVGDIVREAFNKTGIPMTRENIDDFSKGMMEAHGPDHWLKQCVQKIKMEGYGRAIVDGIRTMNNHEVVKEAFNGDYLLFKVDAEPMVRFKRLQSRGRADLPKNLQEFKSQEESQNKIFRINETFKIVDWTIDNSTTLEELYERIRKIAQKYPEWF